MRKQIKACWQKGNAFLQTAAAAKLFLLYDGALCLSKLLLFCSSGYLFFLLDGVLTGCVVASLWIRLRKRSERRMTWAYALLSLVILAVGIMILCFADETTHDPRIGKYTLLIAVGMSVGTLCSLIGNGVSLVLAHKRQSYEMLMRRLIELSCALVGLCLTRAAILSMTNPSAFPAMSHATSVLVGDGTIFIALLIGLRSIQKQFMRKKESCES